MEMTRDLAHALLAGKSGRTTSDDEVDVFLRKWAQGDPVMPVSMVCDFLTEWQDAWGRKTAAKDAKPQDVDFAGAIRRVFRAITKSNLLARRVYAGEKLRTRPCPVHKGQWSGCKLPKDSGCDGACMSGANVTGWLPEA